MALGAVTTRAIRARMAATEDLVRQVAGVTQAQMKTAAPWRDRTGHARASLAATVERAPQSSGRRIVLTLGYHGTPGVDYGLYLEKKLAGRYAIVDPTADRLAPALARRVRALWSRP